MGEGHPITWEHIGIGFGLLVFILWITVVIMLPTWESRFMALVGFPMIILTGILSFLGSWFRENKDDKH
jgi:ABC-type transport system involved in cytochrome c biogenesis permease subunit